MAHTKPGTRGCGTRVEGGIYAECGHSPFGKPLEHFLIDPPVVVDPDEIGLSSIGVALMEGPDGITHVVDWVGAKHYPNVADFLEEVRAMGMSRRLPKSLDFSKLQHGSRVMLVHPKAWIDDFAAYYAATDHICPKQIPDHFWDLERRETMPDEMCAGLFWHDVVPDLSRAEREMMYAAGELEFVRHMPSFSYNAKMRPEAVTPDYLPAFFASFPITNLSVIRTEDGSHEQSLDVVQSAQIDFSLDDA